jgi:hypothetical protein
MTQNTIYSAFYTLLRAGLWNIDPSSNCFPLSDDRWVELYDISCKQTVQGVVFDGIQRLAIDNLPPKKVLLKWIAVVDQIERNNQQMDIAVGELGKLFRDRGLHPYLLKGQAVASCYEIPHHRLCGDIDWYFPTSESYREAIGLIRSQGIGVEYTAGFSAEYLWGKCKIEHHSRILDIHNPLIGRYLASLEKAEFQHKLHKQFGTQIVEHPSPLLTIVLVNVHILKHLLLFGVGIRQLCDSARVYCTYHQEIDGEHLESVYRRLGISRWIQLLHSLLVSHLGLPECYLPFPLDNKVDPLWMMDEVLNSGNFGFHDTRLGLSDEQKNRKRGHVATRWLRAFRLYFPYAPAEVCWFPLIQFFSRIRKIPKE